MSVVLCSDAVASAAARGRRVLGPLLGGLICAAASLAPAAHAQSVDVSGDTPMIARAELLGELPDAGTAPVEPPPAPGHDSVNLVLAGLKTGAERYSDTHSSLRKKRRRPVAFLSRARVADDANFTNRTRFLARRIEETSKSAGAPGRGIATTGKEFLDALVAASRRGPITNLVIYGHASSTALFMREDRGFYASVMEVAKTSHIVSGEDVDRDEQLRAAGARDLYEFEWLLNRGEIRFARNAVIVFAGCGVAGKRDINPNGIAARMAEIVGIKVIASIDVTDQSMGRGRHFRNHEYSRRTWVRFMGGQTPERLNTRVIDALQQLNLEGATMVSRSLPLAAAGGSN